VDLTGSALFTTYYPNVEDMKLLITAGIVILSFFGEVNDISSRDLSNSLAPASIPLEIIQLQ
jgi:hypothetical protein